MENTIFVQVASYRDPQLVPTVLDMINKADHPENLHICVCWQHAEDETVEIFLDAGFDIEAIDDRNSTGAFNLIGLSLKGASVNLINVNYLKTQGACWARNLIQQEYKKEKYTLQLDSHHRFIPNWDSVLIDQLELARTESEFGKPVLTAYVPSFDPENDPGARVKEPWKMDFDRFIPEGAVFFLPATIDDWAIRKTPMRARFYSGHFAFADGSFAVEVQHDPDYFFHGEEISIGVRAYTHGYDLFHPIKTIVWHEYTRKGRVKVWDDHTTPERTRGRVDKDWVQRNDSCHKRNRILFGMDGEDPKQINFGKYGFGTLRTLKDFEEFAGMSFKYRGVQQCVLDKKEPTTDYTKYESEDEWKATLTRSNDVRILINKKELKEGVDDYDFWYLGTHDDDGEVFRKDKGEGEIKTLLTGNPEWLDFRFIYLSNRIAKTYTVWPHSKSLGWLDKITKDIN
jgi:hypothetical protein